MGGQHCARVCVCVMITCFLLLLQWACESHSTSLLHIPQKSEQFQVARSELFLGVSSLVFRSSKECDSLLVVCVCWTQLDLPNVCECVYPLPGEGCVLLGLWTLEQRAKSFEVDFGGASQKEAALSSTLKGFRVKPRELVELERPKAGLSRSARFDVICDAWPRLQRRDHTLKTKQKACRQLMAWSQRLDKKRRLHECRLQKHVCAHERIPFAPNQCSLLLSLQS